MKSNHRKVRFVVPKNSLGARFQHYREIKKFTDVKVKAGNIEIDAHKMILQAASPMIKEMFESSCFDGNVLEFERENVDPEILEDLLNVFYTIQIEISTQNVISLCIASHFLDISNLLKKCETFLLDEICVESVTDLYCLSCDFELGILKQRCLNYFETDEVLFPTLNILENFKLLALNFDDIEEFLKKIMLGNKQQNFVKINLKEEMYHFIKLWVYDDLESRETFLLNLLQILPLKKFSDSFLMKHVLAPSLINKFPSCLKLFNETLEEIRSASQTFGSSRLYFLNDWMFKFEISYLNVMNGKWRTLIEIPELHNFSGTAVIGKKIYFCGDETEESFNLKMFDCEHETWTTLCPIPLDIGNFKMTTLNGLIYIAGGYRLSTLSPVSNVFQYSPTTNEWTEVERMKQERCGQQLVTLNGLIYAIGGRNDETVECYNPVTNRWNYVASFEFDNQNRISSAVSHSNRIYALNINKLQVFNPEINTWKKLPYPPIEKYGKLVSMNDKLLFFGGFINRGYAKSKILFEFNTTKKSWNKLLDIDHEPKFREAVVVNF